MNKILWTAELPIYRNYDLVANSLVPLSNSLVAAGFTPLFANVPSPKQALQMLKLMNSPHFCMIQEARNGTCWPVPTLDRTNQNFSTHNYWRGPTWINIDWILLKGLENYRNVSSEFREYATQLKNTILRLPQIVGFYEYFNPLGREGHGSGN
jgi:neutral trehalase